VTVQQDFMSRGFGKQPAQHGRPHIKLSHVMRRGPVDAVAIPSKVDFYSLITSWGVLANFDWGCCVFSGMGHCAIQDAAYSDDTVAPDVTDGTTLAAYAACTGFNPNAGPPGNNPTDNGAYVQDALAFWRKNPLWAETPIAAYASVDVSNTDQFKTALSKFGQIFLGVQLPDSALQQFDNGKDWTTVKGAKILGGHLVLVVGYDEKYVYLVSWGKVVRATWGFLQKYADEAWIVVTHETIQADGRNAYGGILDVGALGEEFANITGEPNPFAVIPRDDVDPDDVEMWEAALHWAATRGLA
jgi:hypothetical protein